MCVKDKFYSSAEGLHRYLKRLQHRYFSVNIPKVLGTASFIETLVAAFALTFSIKKEL